MSGKKLSFLEIAKLNKDKIVKKEVIVEEPKKKEDNNYCSGPCYIKCFFFFIIT